MHIAGAVAHTTAPCCCYLEEFIIGWQSIPCLFLRFAYVSGRLGNMKTNSCNQNRSQFRPNSLTLPLHFNLIKTT